MLAEWVLAALVLGSLVYCLLVVVAARDYLGQEPVVRPPAPMPISILKPLAGADEGLAENLRSYFTQDYPEFEVLLAVREESDAAWAVAESVRAEFPGVPSRLIATGEPAWPNAKVWSLAALTREARYEVLAMADSDVRVCGDFLRTVAAEFQAGGMDLATCPYRAVPGRSFWPTLEAIGMNTEFLAGILVARLLEGMKFAVGPTIVARRSVITSIGGWEKLRDYLAEDFVLGQLAAEKSFRTGLSRYVIEHRIGAQGFAANFRHRLRWCRSTRRSRPAGYAGQIFTNPLPLVLLLLAVDTAWWPLGAAALAGRAVAAWAVAGWVLRDTLCKRLWWLIPVQDMASFFFWAAGFFGNTIAWRGRSYHLRADGRFERIA